jgi:phosphoglucosamine mutase
VTATTFPPRLFGTDGIRAPFGTWPLDRPTVRALGWHLGRLLAQRSAAGESPSVVLGGDTRESTPELVRWLAGGLTAAGAEPRPLGVMTTPGIAFLTRDLAAAAGVAVSASHNPHPDNGIKLLDAGGFKWSRTAEEELEERIASGPRPPEVTRATGGGFGAEAPEAAAADTAEEAPALTERYLGSLRSSLPGAAPLRGLSVVLDPGHGAASPFAGPLFASLGARVTVLSASPDGRNINRDSGSTRPEAMAAEVQRRRAHLGLAFDGDADRVILADETGAVRDGDAILYLWATALAEAGELEPRRIVATSMSNLGLERALARHGIALVRCDVGDRWVVETLQREGLLLGGEQSGHVIHLGLATTGDGLLTGLHMAARVAAAPERSLSRLLAGFVRYPQVLLNVRVAEKRDLADLPRVVAAERRARERLGEEGRLVLRYSGTEPLARIMIEGRDQQEIESLAEEIAGAIRDELGA